MFYFLSKLLKTYDSYYDDCDESLKVQLYNKGTSDSYEQGYESEYAIFHEKYMKKRTSYYF